MAKIGEARYDEKGNLAFGKRGDQTGNEVSVRTFGKTGENWQWVFRCDDDRVAENMGEAMIQACINDNIGYAQYGNTDADGRYSLWDEMHKTGNILKITTPCNCDCSALVACCVTIAGIPITKFMWTANETEVLMGTKRFTKLPFVNGMTLYKGDVLLRLTPVGHTAIVVDGDSDVRPSASHKLNGLDYNHVFDSKFYIGKYEDLRRAGITTDAKAWEHFVKYGMKEHRQAKSDFIVDNYKNRYPDLQKAFGSNIEAYYRHYCEFGHAENRNAK